MKKVFLAAVVLFTLSSGTSFAKETVQNIQLEVTEKGFVPDKISVKPGTHVVLKVTRKTDSTCATEIAIKEKNIKKELPLNKEVSVDAGILQKGKVTFACGMNMVTGYIVVE